MIFQKDTAATHTINLLENLDLPDHHFKLSKYNEQILRT